MPLLYKSVSRDTYGFLIGKFKKKLSAWNGWNMSVVTCALLIQTSLNSIARYEMHTPKLPINLLDHLEKISWRFLWGEV